MNFVALDVETANPQMSSICQVGIAVFKDGRLNDSFVSLVNPQGYFYGANVAVHGIDEEDVEDAPTFPELYSTLADYLTGNIAVSYSAFDRNAINQAATRFNLPYVECRWLDAARVVRRTWSDCAHSGYGLKAVAAKLGIGFQHHDAYEDARAAGEILLRAIAESGVTLERWLTKSLYPLESDHSLRSPRRWDKTLPVARDGDPDGPLRGECVVFTGALSIARHLAADAAARVGCTVADSVTKKTSILVVGDQDISRLRPNETKSSKHLKAEAMIAKGHPIRIIGESDFMALCALEVA